MALAAAVCTLGCARRVLLASWPRSVAAVVVSAFPVLGSASSSGAQLLLVLVWRRPAVPSGLLVVLGYVDGVPSERGVVAERHPVLIGVEETTRVGCGTHFPLSWSAPRPQAPQAY